MIVLGRESCGNLEIASRKEWLETNGLGGYASGTVAGMHTRSYHALLVAAQQPPLNRIILLAQLEETVTYAGHKFSLSTHQYRDTVAPKGFLNLEEFRLDPYPVFTYRTADLLIEKAVFMTYGSNCVWITYRLLSEPQEEVLLSVRPLVNFREHHLRRRERRFVNTHHDLDKHMIRMLPDRNMPALNIYHNAFGYEHSSLWYHDLFYSEEKRRGLESEEDLFSPGVMSFRLDPLSHSFLAATTGTLEKPDPQVASQNELQRRRFRTQAALPGDAFGHQLLLAADQFLVKRDRGLSVIAGYPWMGDCGRDAMIALPGLTLAAKHPEDARALLALMASYCSEGMLPNHFSEETNQPDYNTVDAALWFILAVHRFVQATNDLAFVREKCWPAIEEIIDAYIKGTRYHLRMDDDGLINLPEEGAQLTWMDAQVGDWVVTPRSGKPVEVNALWYNALCVARDLADTFKDTKAREWYARQAEKTRTGFQDLFWNEKEGCCFDRIEDHFRDPILRPNQILAVSLPFPLLDSEQARRLLARIKLELYTSFGFRTLDRSNEHYHGTYSGDLLSREGAAYEGTVWPWLLGAYADALRGLWGDTERVREELRQLLKPFELHLLDAGLGTISEMFDGDPPHTARGCIARAWNVAEILRVHLSLLQ